MNEKLIQLLEGLPRTSDFVFPSKTGGHLFNNFDRGFRSAIKGATIKHLETIGAHVLRHTFISHLLITGKQNVFTVAKIAGHSSIKTTQIYLTLLGSDDEKQKAVEALPDFEK
jgi:integrase/recombinase XerD